MVSPDEEPSEHIPPLASGTPPSLGFQQSIGRRRYHTSYPSRPSFGLSFSSHRPGLPRLRRALDGRLPSRKFPVSILICGRSASTNDVASRDDGQTGQAARMRPNIYVKGTGRCTGARNVDLWPLRLRPVSLCRRMIAPGLWTRLNSRLADTSWLCLYASDISRPGAMTCQQPFSDATPDVGILPAPSCGDRRLHRESGQKSNLPRASCVGWARMTMWRDWR